MASLLDRHIRSEIKHALSGAVETKWASAPIAAVAITTAAPSIQFHAGLGQGVAYNQRIGNKVAWDRLKFTFLASSFPGRLADTFVRVVVINDTQADAATFGTATLFPPGTAAADQWYAQFNRDQVPARYRIYADKLFTVRPRTIATASNAAPNVTLTLTPALVSHKFSIPLHGMHTQYNDSNTAGIADVISNAFFICIFTDAPVGFGPTIAYHWMKSWKDV